MNPPTTAQTGLVLPLFHDNPAKRGFAGMAVTIWDEDNEVVAYVPNMHHATELVRLANAHCELVGALRSALDCIERTDAEHIWLNAPETPEITLGEMLRTALANATRQTQV